MVLNSLYLVVKLEDSKDVVTICFSLFTDKPVITNLQDKYDVIAGDTVKLQCSVFAYPPVITSTWTRNSTGTFQNVFTDGNKFQISGNSTFSLQINKVDLSDKGVYLCRSTNDAGTTIGASIVLHVIGGKSSFIILLTCSF